MLLDSLSFKYSTILTSTIASNFIIKHVISNYISFRLGPALSKNRCATTSHLTLKRLTKNQKIKQI